MTIGAYSWVTAMEGTAGFKGLTGSAHTSMRETLQRLDFAYMGYLEVGYQRWSLATDLIYAQFSNDMGYHFGPISGDLDFKLRQVFLTGRLQYRLIDTERYQLDLFAGVRWNYVRSEVDVHSNIRFTQPLLRPFNGTINRRMVFSENWVDPIIGARHLYNFTDKWFGLLSGDVGGFSVGSSFTWQVMGGVGYRFSPHISCMTSYRAMGINYESGDLKLDTVSHGPQLSLIVNF